MTTNRHDFEELDAPAAAATKLGISVATLRKYSLIIEKVTGNKNYFQRTKQKARLYHQKDLVDLKAFHRLAEKSNLTLQEAARQIYAVSDKKMKKAENRHQELLDSAQMAKLLGALQQTIAHQNKALAGLQAQLTRIEKQNESLLASQKKLMAPVKDKQINPKIAAMPDISGIVSDNEEQHRTKPMTREEKRREIAADAKKSEKQLHQEILAKARENANKREHVNVHRTLEDMQLPPKKKHWWQRFLNS